MKHLGLGRNTSRVSDIRLRDKTCQQNWFAVAYKNGLPNIILTTTP